MYRAFTHSFMKVTSRHSFTLFRPFLWKKPLFRGENGVWKCPANVQIMPMVMKSNWESSLLKTCSRAKDSLQWLSLGWIWRRKDTERQRNETVCQPPYLPWRTVDKRQDDSVKTTGIIIVSTHFLFVSLHSCRQFSLSWQVQVKRCLCFGW